MNTSDIDVMLAEKGDPCVTIVIATHQYTKDRMQNPELVEKAIQKARKLLANSAWPKEKLQQLEMKFSLILERIDFIRLQEGLAIFVSPNILKIQLVPFPVKDKVMVGPGFEIRDLIYYAQFLRPYYLFAASKKKVRLFKGTGRDLQELVNDDFPRDYVEEYEYAKPSIGSSSSSGLKSFEKDKSVVQETRLRSFLKEADGILSKYIKGETPLFIAAVGEELTSFEKVTRHLDNVAGKIEGNYDFDAIHPLAETAWMKMKELVQASNEELLVKLRDDLGRKLAVTGIINAWRAAWEGKGLALLLEKDYEVMAYQDPGNMSGISTSTMGKEAMVLSDAADDLIKIVREKGGKVVMFENGALAQFDRVALLLRYE